MSIEIVMRRRNGDGEIVQEAMIAHYYEYLFGYSDYREAAFSQAARLLWDKLEQHRKGKPNE